MEDHIVPRVVLGTSTDGSNIALAQSLLPGSSMDISPVSSLYPSEASRALGAAYRRVIRGPNDDWVDHLWRSCALECKPRVHAEGVRCKS